MAKDILIVPGSSNIEFSGSAVNDIKLETLDSIIDTAKNEVDAAGEFKFLEDGFDLLDDPKPPKPPRDKKAGGGLSYLMGM